MNLRRELECFLQKEPIENQTNLLKGMEENIGSADPYLRDQLIYRAYYHFIFDGHLNQDQLHRLMTTLLKDEFFHYNLGEQNTDSVFQRSFSALVIALLLEYDCIHRVFDQDQIEKAANQAILYMMNEKDVRGYVEGKGWAHAIAHGADVLDGLAKHHFFNDIQRLLSAIEIPLLCGHAFTDDEEERLAIPVISLLTTKQAEEKILKWIDQITDRTNRLIIDSKGSIQPYRVQHTVKNFLKSLYFFLKFKDESKKVRQKVSEILMNWSI